MLGNSTINDNDDASSVQEQENNNNSSTSNPYLSMAWSVLKSTVLKFQQFLRTLPLVTSILVGIFTIGYLLELILYYLSLFGDDKFLLFQASSIIEKKQIYRLVTSIYFHSSITHYLVVVVTTLFLLGTKLERNVGSLLLAFLLLVGLLVQPSLQLLLSWLPSTTLNMNVFYDAYCRGFSGILFQFITYEYGTSKKQLPIPCAAADNTTTIPVNCLPWVLLFVAEIIFWNSSSFVSHLSGILVGYGMVYTKRVWLSSVGTFCHTYLERDNDSDGCFFRCCIGQTNFISTPDDILLMNNNDNDTTDEEDEDGNYSSPDYRPLETQEL